jgi:hypothetical protein
MGSAAALHNTPGNIAPPSPLNVSTLNVIIGGICIPAKKININITPRRLIYALTVPGRLGVPLCPNMHANNRIVYQIHPAPAVLIVCPCNAYSAAL